MKNIAYSIILIFIFSPSFSQLFYTQKLSTVNSCCSTGWKNASFTSEKTAYITNYGGSDIYKWYEDEERWDPIYNNDILSVHFIDDSLLFSYTYDGLARSKNGGTDWEFVSNKPLANWYPAQIKFKNENTGLLYEPDFPHRLFLTTDFGSNWEEILRNSTLQYYSMINDSIGYVLIEDTLLTTTNAGQTWDRLGMLDEINFPLQINDVFKSSSSLFISKLDENLKEIQLPDSLLNKSESIVAFDFNKKGNGILMSKENEVFTIWYFNDEWFKVLQKEGSDQAYSLSINDSDEMILTNSTLNIIEHINLFKNLSSTLNDTTFTINENLTNGTIIGSLSASNIYGDDLVYSIISGNELNGFALDTARGILSVLDSSIIDFELNPSYKLLVSVGGDRLTDSLTVDINIVDNIESPFLCSVQSNENNFNVVRWTTTQDVLYHNIYREESTGRFELIGQVSFNSNQLFVDSTSNVQARSYKYLLTAVNSDSVESEPSRIHQTILLQAGEGINNDVLLTWNQYEGIEYDNIEILRGSNENNLEVIATLSSNNFRYTDLTPVDAQKFIEFVSHLMIFVLAVI